MLEHAEDDGARVDARRRRPRRTCSTTSTSARRPRPAPARQGADGDRRRPLDELVHRARRRIRRGRQLVYPDLAEDDGVRAALGRARARPAARRARPGGAWDERMAVLSDAGADDSARALRRDRAARAGHGADGRPAADAPLVGRRLHDAPTGSATCRTCRPKRSSRRPIRCARPATSPRRSRSRCATARSSAALRVRFEDGVAVEIDADENADALRVAARDRRGRAPPRRARAGRPPGPHRAARHRLLQHAARRERREPHRARRRLPVPRRRGRSSRASTRARQHIDFMIGSPEVDVDGVTADGERVPVLRGGDWQI